MTSLKRDVHGRVCEKMTTSFADIASITAGTRKFINHT